MQKVIKSFKRGVQGYNDHLTVSINGNSADVLAEREKLQNMKVKSFTNPNLIVSFSLLDVSPFKNGISMKLIMMDAKEEIFNELINRGYGIASL